MQKNSSSILKNLIFCITLALIPFVSWRGSLYSAENQIQEPNPKIKISPQLLQNLNSQKKIPVIVKLNDGNIINSNYIENVNNEDHLQKIKRLQDKVLDKIGKDFVRGVKKLKYLPYISLEVSRVQLNQLSSFSEVDSLYDNQMMKMKLTESTNLVDADSMWSSEYTGTGQTIAILDSGVDKTHEFLQNKVVSEACYSSNYGNYPNSTLSICPNGQESQIGEGSGVAYSNWYSSGYLYSGYDHGTFVAGIAAGSGSSFSGVAKDSTIISIQTYSRGYTSEVCEEDSLCLVSWEFDVLLGMERVYELRNSYHIAAVNLSLGSGSYTNQNACDNEKSYYKTYIDLLRSVGIATIVASGNDGYVNALSAPACISSAISVGSTTKSDTVSYFTNNASFLNLLAPGSQINSSIPGNSYAIGDGTSLSAPHVSGAFALLRSRMPQARVEQIEDSLIRSGKPILDPGNGLSKPRIDIDAAMEMMSCSPPAVGDWNITSSCTLENNTTVTGNVSVYNGSVLTIKSGKTLSLDLEHKYLKTNASSGVYLMTGAKIE